MSKKLSAKLQRDMLLEALEENLDMIRKYRRERDAEAEKATPASVLHVHNYGMARGAEFCAEISERTLKAAQWAKKEAEKE